MRIPALMIGAALLVPMSVMGQEVGENHMTLHESPQLPIQAQHFLNLLSSEDQSEINLANLALKKSNNPQVKEYAKSKILAADPAMEEGAKAIAQQNHVPDVAAPTDTDKAEYYYLSRLSGKEFDMAYIDYEDQKQTADLIMVQNEEATEKNPQLKSFVQKEETPVREAAQSAKQIAQALGL